MELLLVICSGEQNHDGLSSLTGGDVFHGESVGYQEVDLAPKPAGQPTRLCRISEPRHKKSWYEEWCLMLTFCDHADTPALI